MSRATRRVRRVAVRVARLPYVLGKKVRLWAEGHPEFSEAVMEVFRELSGLAKLYEESSGQGPWR